MVQTSSRGVTIVGRSIVVSPTATVDGAASARVSGLRDSLPFLSSLNSAESSSDDKSDHEPTSILTGGDDGLHL